MAYLSTITMSSESGRKVVAVVQAEASGKQKNAPFLSMVVLIRSFVAGPRPSSKRATTPNYVQHYKQVPPFLA